MPSSFGFHRMSSSCARGAAASGGVTFMRAASLFMPSTCSYRWSSEGAREGESGWTTDSAGPQGSRERVGSTGGSSRGNHGRDRSTGTGEGPGDKGRGSGRRITAEGRGRKEKSKRIRSMCIRSQSRLRADMVATVERDESGMSSK